MLARKEAKVGRASDGDAFPASLCVAGIFFGLAFRRAKAVSAEVALAFFVFFAIFSIFFERRAEASLEKKK